MAEMLGVPQGDDFNDNMGCILSTSPLTTFFEILGAALLLYQLTRQYDLWKEDIENLQELAECYEEIGTRYKTARLGLRARDTEVYDYQNSRPSYPGPCYQHVTQARLNSLLDIQEQHEQSLKALPAWACGDRNNINYEAAKAEVTGALNSMAESENYEQNQVDRYEQMRITAIARSTGGAIPNVSGAFRTSAAIAQDSLSRTTASFNSALGAFGNAVGSISNKYFSNERVGRTPNQQSNTTNNINTINDGSKFEGFANNRLQQNNNNSLVEFSGNTAFEVVG